MESKKKYGAIALCLIIGFLATKSTDLQSSVFGRVVMGGPMVALLVSMVICNLIPSVDKSFKEGTTYCSKRKDSVLSVAQKIFPMFILWFVVMAGLNTYGVFSPAGSSLLKTVSKFLFASALAGVGFKIKFKDVFSKGLKPIALGGITWACVAASSYLFAFLFAGYIG